MSAPGKRVPAILLVLLLATIAGHYLLKQQLEDRLASEAAVRRRELTDLRAENRRLQNGAAAATVVSSAPAAPELPAQVRQMNAATELLKTGLFGPFAWTRGQNNSLADEVAALADALGLSEAQKAAILAAAEKGQREVVAAVLASAKVQVHDNAERGAAETREESIERSRLMQNAPPAEQLAISARMLSKQASSRGEREVSVEIPESPEARAAFDAMQASFAQIMGPDAYAFYQSVGAAKTMEGIFDELGLQPHWLSLISRPSGTTSASEETLRAAMARARETAIAAGKAPPPEMPVSTAPASPQGMVYEFHRIIAMSTWSTPVTRSTNGLGAGGGGSGSPLSGVIQSGGVSYGSSQAITGEALRNAMGPLQSLLPPGF